MSKATWINIDNVWKEVKNIWINVNGVWEEKIIPKGNINGNWKEFIQYTLQKLLEYQFNESTSSSRSNTFTLENLMTIDKITVDNGNVTYSISGNKVTVNVSGGNCKSVYNSSKYSKSVGEYQTNKTDIFPTNMGYSFDGYSGTLSRDGISYVFSGSYTPSESKTVTDYKASSVNNFPNSINFSSDGYNGTLYKDGSTYVFSGNYTSSDSKIVEKKYSRFISYENGEFTTFLPKTIEYNENGYLGTLSSPKLSPEQEKFQEDVFLYKLTGSQYMTAIYKGTVTKPASDTRVYRQNYRGTVTKPASDTRVYRQNYKGYVYKGGYDYYYKYKINMKYTIKN